MGDSMMARRFGPAMAMALRQSSSVESMSGTWDMALMLDELKKRANRYGPYEVVAVNQTLDPVNCILRFTVAVKTKTGVLMFTATREMKKTSQAMNVMCKEILEEYLKWAQDVQESQLELPWTEERKQLEDKKE